MHKIKVVVSNGEDVAIYMILTVHDAERFLSEGLKKGYVTIPAGSTLAEGARTVDKNMFVPTSRVAFIQ
jgi:hypothetical protein